MRSFAHFSQYLARGWRSVMSALQVRQARCFGFLLALRLLYSSRLRFRLASSAHFSQYTAALPRCEMSAGHILQVLFASTHMAGLLFLFPFFKFNSQQLNIAVRLHHHCEPFVLHIYPLEFMDPANELHFLEHLPNVCLALSLQAHFAVQNFQCVFSHFSASLCFK